MADEKRRLIYELLVEAKGVADGAKQARSELTDVTRIVGVAKTAFAGMFAGFTVVGVLRGLAQVNDEITRITQQLKVFGVEGAAARDAIARLQDIAVSTGSNLQSVTNAFKDLMDVSETLGLSQKEVADLTEAATRAMLAQGGTAEQAASQISTLAFAIEKGAITSKELKSVLKENDILQQAFEIALGKTTAEIIKQAEASGINAEEMRRVLEVYTELGKEQTVAPTMATITAAAWESAKAFASAFNETSGFSLAMKTLGTAILPESAEASRDWGQAVANAFLLVIPGAIAWRKELEAIAALQEKLKPLPSLQQSAEQTARWGPQPVPLTPAERRLEPDEFAGGHPEMLDADRQALRDQQHIDAMTQTARIQGNLLELTLRTRRETEAIAQGYDDIAATMPEQVEVMEDLVDAQQLQSKWHEQNLENLEVTIAGAEDFGVKVKSGMIEAVEASQVLAHSMMGIFTGATHNARDFFRSLLQGLAEVAAQKAILGMLGDTGKKEGTKASGIMGFLAGLFASARGNVFEHGRVVPMAEGGIVTGPTMFPLAGGRMGLMGEAGAEAVMPLRRGSDGRLGVSGTAPTVILNNQTGVQFTQTHVLGTAERLEITLRSAQLGAQMAVAEVNRSIRTGYGITATSLARSYGMRRRV